MSEEETTKPGSRPMIETFMGVEGTKKIGPAPDRKKAAEHLLKAYSDSPETRDNAIMKNFENSVNEPAKSIGERIDGA